MIDWKDAPDWANYAAMDKDGMWHWYECEPEPRSIDWCCAGKYEVTKAKTNWLDSLQCRDKGAMK